MIASSKNQVSTRRKKDTKHKRQNAKGKRQGKEVEGVNDNNTTSINCAKFLVFDEARLRQLNQTCLDGPKSLPGYL